MSVNLSQTQIFSSRRSRFSTPISRYRQSGVSLVELLVAVTIGLFLMGAVVLIYVNTSSASKASSLESEMNENASIALEMLRHQIGLTGFSDVIATTGLPVFSQLAIRGCDGGFGTPTSPLNAAAKVFDDATLLCSDATTAATDSDALAIRYQATLLNSQVVKGSAEVVEDLTATPPVVAAAAVDDRPANCNYEGITQNTTVNGIAVSLAYDRYYIDTDATTGEKALFCKGATGDGTYGSATALIPNIEDLQLRYALTLAPMADEVIPHQVTGYAKASDDELKAADLSSWPRVAGVEICLVARSSRRTPGWNETDIKTDFSTYRDCSNTEITSKADGYLRRAYRTTVFLRNLRPGVPTPYQLNTNPWAQQLSTSEDS